MLPGTVVELQHDLLGRIVRVQVDIGEQAIALGHPQRFTCPGEEMLAQPLGGSFRSFLAAVDRAVDELPTALGPAPAGTSSSIQTISTGSELGFGRLLGLDVLVAGHPAADLRRNESTFARSGRSAISARRSAPRPPAPDPCGSRPSGCRRCC
jgi:hypothetical protein